MSGHPTAMALDDNSATEQGFFDMNLGMESVRIFPGQVYCTNQNIVLSTGLGSCVAVCLWDREKKLGGINHFLLPEPPSNIVAGTAPLRYGNGAIPALIDGLMALGAEKAHLRAVVLGGARLFGDSENHVGKLNCDFAVQYLSTRGIKIVMTRVLEEVARSVKFYPATGRVTVKMPGTKRPDLIAEMGAAS